MLKREFMKLSRSLLVGMGLVLASTASVQADDAAARDVINTAIKKNGGEALLSKFPGRSSKIKGTMYLLGSAVPITGELVSQNGNQHRMSISLSVDGQTVSFVSVLNGKEGWQRLYDQTAEMTDDQMAEARAAAYAGWLATLVPLQDKAFQLTLAGETEVGRRPAIGINVTREGHRPFKMYFDKETYRLVRTETNVVDESTAKEVAQESTYSDFKVVEGVPHAGKISIKRDGQPHVDVEVVEFKPGEKLADSFFAKP